MRILFRLNFTLLRLRMCHLVLLSFYYLFHLIGFMLNLWWFHVKRVLVIIIVIPVWLTCSGSLHMCVIARAYGKARNIFILEHYNYYSSWMFMAWHFEWLKLLDNFFYWWTFYMKGLNSPIGCKTQRLHFFSFNEFLDGLFEI